MLDAGLRVDALVAAEGCVFAARLLASALGALFLVAAEVATLSTVFGVGLGAHTHVVAECLLRGAGGNALTVGAGAIGRACHILAGVGWSDTTSHVEEINNQDGSKPNSNMF